MIISMDGFGSDEPGADQGASGRQWQGAVRGSETGGDRSQWQKNPCLPALGDTFRNFQPEAGMQELPGKSDAERLMAQFYAVLSKAMGLKRRHPVLHPLPPKSQLPISPHVRLLREWRDETAFVMKRVLSVNVGLPRQVPTDHATVLTSIFKSPVEGRVAVRRDNIEGDKQSDLTAHGGPNKAVYCYPWEHYSFWKEQLPDMELPYGVFGENLTTEGITEEAVLIGDQFRVGSTVLKVTQPRMPCFKLEIRFGRGDMVKRFWQSVRPGIYFAVVAEGGIAAGDPIERIAEGPEKVSVADVVRLYRGDETSAQLLERALRAPLSGSWKEKLRERKGV
ncbi:MAG: MOSC domain-containing protein [Terriglobia bacterium]